MRSGKTSVTNELQENWASQLIKEIKSIKCQIKILHLAKFVSTWKLEWPSLLCVFDQWSWSPVGWSNKCSTTVSLHKSKLWAQMWCNKCPPSKNHLQQTAPNMEFFQEIIAEGHIHESHYWQLLCYIIYIAYLIIESLWLCRQETLTK